MTPNEAVSTIQEFVDSHMLFRKLVCNLSDVNVAGWSRSPNAIMVTIAVEPFTIAWVNDAFVDMYGYLEEECIGATPKTLFQGVHTDKTHASNKKHACLNMVLVNQCFCDSMMNYRKDGTTVNVDMVIHRMLLDDDSAFLLTSMKYTPPIHAF